MAASSPLPPAADHPADHPADGDSLPRQLARTRRLTLGAPDDFTVTADGATVLFLRSRGGADARTCLWARELATGEERVVADAGEGAVAAYATDASGRRAAFVRAGELWLAEIGAVGEIGAGGAGSVGGAGREIGAGGAVGAGREVGAVSAVGEPDTLRRVLGADADRPVAEPRPDPTGRRIAYRSGRELRVVDLDGTLGNSDRAVAAPGPQDGPEVGYGAVEHAAESMGRHRGYWWAPDGERLLVTRVDEEPVAVWYVADPADPAVPPRAVRYPSVGTANADVRLGIVDAVQGGWTEVDWDRAAFEYLTAADWDAHGPLASVQSRDQRTVRTLAIDGLADDNVFPVSTLRLSAALLAAGRPHEVLPLGGAGHRVTQEAVVENLILHQLDFLRRALRLDGREG